VTSIAVARPYGLADGTFENGWKWIFDVTVPANETEVTMTFGDLTDGAKTIPATNNIRYTTLNDDMSPTIPERQIQIVVEARIPEGTIDGSYNLNYTIESKPDMQRPVITIEDGLNPLLVQVHDSLFDVNDRNKYRVTSYDSTSGLYLPVDIEAGIDGSGIDVNTMGTYIVTYRSCCNSANRDAIPVTRTVIVGNYSIFKFTLNGDNPQTVELGQPYIDPGFSVWATLSHIVSTTTDMSAVNNALTNNATGTFPVIYRAVDSYGTASSTTRIVNIIPAINR
jgi:hypothetical protein